MNKNILCFLIAVVRILSLLPTDFNLKIIFRKTAVLSRKKLAAILYNRSTETVTSTIFVGFYKHRYNIICI